MFSHAFYFSEHFSNRKLSRIFSTFVLRKFLINDKVKAAILFDDYVKAKKK